MKTQCNLQSFLIKPQIFIMLLILAMSTLMAAKKKESPFYEYSSFGYYSWLGFGSREFQLSNKSVQVPSRDYSFCTTYNIIHSKYQTEIIDLSWHRNLLLFKPKAVTRDLFHMSFSKEENYPIRLGLNYLQRGGVGVEIYKIATNYSLSFFNEQLVPMGRFFNLEGSNQFAGTPIISGTTLRAELAPGIRYCPNEFINLDLYLGGVGWLTFERVTKTTPKISTSIFYGHQLSASFKISAQFRLIEPYAAYKAILFSTEKSLLTPFISAGKIDHLIIFGVNLKFKLLLLG